MDRNFSMNIDGMTLDRSQMYKIKEEYKKLLTMEYLAEQPKYKNYTDKDIETFAEYVLEAYDNFDYSEDQNYCIELAVEDFIKDYGDPNDRKLIGPYTNEDIANFVKDVKTNYSELYNSEDTSSAEFKELVKNGENLLQNLLNNSEYHSFIKDFLNARGDYISSDREIAAFYLAYQQSSINPTREYISVAMAMSKIEDVMERSTDLYGTFKKPEEIEMHLSEPNAVVECKIAPFTAGEMSVNSITNELSQAQKLYSFEENRNKYALAGEVDITDKHKEILADISSYVSSISKKVYREDANRQFEIPLDESGVIAIQYTNKSMPTEIYNSSNEPVYLSGLKVDGIEMAPTHFLPKEAIYLNEEVRGNLDFSEARVKKEFDSQHELGLERNVKPDISISD